MLRINFALCSFCDFLLGLFMINLSIRLQGCCINYKYISTEPLRVIQSEKECQLLQFRGKKYNKARKCSPFAK